MQLYQVGAWNGSEWTTSARVVREGCEWTGVVGEASAGDVRSKRAVGMAASAADGNLTGRNRCLLPGDGFIEIQQGAAHGCVSGDEGRGGAGGQRVDGGMDAGGEFEWVDPALGEALALLFEK